MTEFTHFRWAFVSLLRLPSDHRRLSNLITVDRDAGRWKVDQAEIQRRREGFWELYSYDLLQVRAHSLHLMVILFRQSLIFKLVLHPWSSAVVHFGAH